MRAALNLLPVLFFLSLAIAPFAGAQSASPGINALPEVEFSRLSQRDPNPLGTKALAINPAQWKHGETEHFIYHFVDSFVVTPIEFSGGVQALDLEEGRGQLAELHLGEAFEHRPPVVDRDAGRLEHHLADGFDVELHFFGSVDAGGEVVDAGGVVVAGAAGGSVAAVRRFGRLNATRSFSMCGMSRSIGLLRFCAAW